MSPSIQALLLFLRCWQQSSQEHGIQHHPSVSDTANAKRWLHGRAAAASSTCTQGCGWQRLLLRQAVTMHSKHVVGKVLSKHARTVSEHQGRPMHNCRCRLYDRNNNPVEACQYWLAESRRQKHVLPRPCSALTVLAYSANMGLCRKQSSAGLQS